MDSRFNAPSSSFVEQHKTVPQQQNLQVQPVQQSLKTKNERVTKHGSLKKKWSFWPRGLSGKLLVITTLFVMLIEIFIFLPSVANFRLTWLNRHFNTGEAASLALEKLQAEDIPDDIREQLLSLTQTETIIVRRDGASRVLASAHMPSAIDRHVELAMPGRRAALQSISEALNTLLYGGNRIIRVYGPMEQRSGVLELVMNEQPLRAEMLRYARNVMLISLAISLFTGLLVFLTLRWFLIRPMQKMSRAMMAFSNAPEDINLTIKPSGRDDEIGIAEEQLKDMQDQLRGTLKQQKNLANLGLAVSKINHDLRNILASASLFSERLSTVADPVVQRVAPRLVRSLDRAVDYTSSVLAYGKAGEAMPKRTLVRLHRICEDVAEALTLDHENEAINKVEWKNEVPLDFEMNADGEQLFRVLLNLSRNAVQVMQEQDDVAVKRLTITAEQTKDKTYIHVIDTGPGFPAEKGDTLFSAFQTSHNAGGTGLGLAIAAELIKAHGGTIALNRDHRVGARFDIELPHDAPRA